MKKWYQWLYLSICFAAGGVLNYLDGRQIIAAVVQVSITVLMAFLQRFCDKKGEKGKKVFKYISIGIILLLVLWLLFLVLGTGA